MGALAKHGVERCVVVDHLDCMILKFRRPSSPCRIAACNAACLCSQLTHSARIKYARYSSTIRRIAACICNVASFILPCNSPRPALNHNSQFQRDLTRALVRQRVRFEKCLSSPVDTMQGWSFVAPPRTPPLLDKRLRCVELLPSGCAAARYFAESSRNRSANSA